MKAIPEGAWTRAIRVLTNRMEENATIMLLSIHPGRILLLRLSMIIYGTNWASKQICSITCRDRYIHGIGRAIIGGSGCAKQWPRIRICRCSYSLAILMVLRIISQENMSCGIWIPVVSCRTVYIGKDIKAAI